MGSIILSLISAIIGTFLGAYFINLFQDNKIKKVRKIACRGLDVIKKYAKRQNPYAEAEKEFNNILNVSEKRAILVCLHKLGIPVEIDLISGFNISNIQLSKIKAIDGEEIELMKLQIMAGHCDNLFFNDVESHFTSDVKIKTIRSIAQKYVSDVLANSILSGKSLLRPDGWINGFSTGELNVILVFISKTWDSDYFDKQTGAAKSGALEKLANEISQGLWDVCLHWDFEAYQNMRAQRRLAEKGANAFEGTNQQQDSSDRLDSST